jgi:hypothetical protein
VRSRGKVVVKAALIVFAVLAFSEVAGAQERPVASTGTADLVSLLTFEQNDIAPFRVDLRVEHQACDDEPLPPRFRGEKTTSRQRIAGVIGEAAAQECIAFAQVGLRGPPRSTAFGKIETTVGFQAHAFSGDVPIDAVIAHLRAEKQEAKLISSREILVVVVGTIEDTTVNRLVEVIRRHLPPPTRTDLIRSDRR